MQLETDNEKAQTLVANAASEIQNYRVERSISKLQSAKEILDEARKEDPHYLSAIYYTAVLDDLLGKAHYAIPSLEKVLEADPPFSDEVRYHLGIAYYHRYNSENLDRAIKCFKQVLEAAQGSILRASASAALGQAYAMKMIPSTPRSMDVAKVREYHDLSLFQGKQSLKLADELDNGQKDAELNEPRWMAHNALGMANMYFSDYDGKPDKKVEVLRSTIDQFNLADEYRPEDWANYCDLASAHMRLAYWSSTQSDYRVAESLLTSVITNLRPEYGFAIYELGRNFRLQGDFEKAIVHFDRALLSPYETRDVSDRRVNIEKERAIREDSVFP